MSIILAANKESLQVNPINWEKLVSRLQLWNNDHMKIPPTTPYTSSTSPLEAPSKRYTQMSSFNKLL